MDTIQKDKIKRIRRSLSLEKAASLLSGENTWETKAIPEAGLSSVRMADGPHGIRLVTENDVISTRTTTCFPLAVTTGCSWDPELILQMAGAIATEANACGVDVILGPGMNIKRSPLCGRNFEYFSEDPYLTGKMAAAYVQGARKQKIGTMPKHFFANNQEERRMTLDVCIDERAAREIYLKAFKMVLEDSRPMALMTAYNRVNGTFMSENKAYVGDLLREEWHYPGLTVTDWNGVYDRVKGVKAGVNLEMPGSGGVNDKKVIEAVRRGQLKRSEFNKNVDKNIAFILKNQGYRKQRHPGAPFDADKHHRLARHIAGESIVLLKNEAGILPILPGSVASMAVIGKMAFEPRIQGAGSSRITPTRIDSPYEALDRIYGEETELMACQGCPDTAGSEDSELLEEAVRIAGRCDRVLLFVGIPPEQESEGYDRKTMDLPEGQRTLIRAVCGANPHTVLIYANGGAVAMDDGQEAQAILETGLAGQAMGSAVADILSGRVNPSGKLAESIPLRLEDTPAYINFPGVGNQVVYGEGVFVGYRYYDYTRRKVAYPFGFGLSYTTFRYKKLTLTEVMANHFDVDVQVENIGSVSGKEVVELYTGKVDGRVQRPLRELRRFKKVAIDPGKTQTVTFHLSSEDFSYFDPDTHGWTFEEGTHRVWAGPSSRELPLGADVRLVPQEARTIGPYSYLGDVQETEKGREFIAAMLGQFEAMTGETVDMEDPFIRALADSTPVIKLLSMSRGLFTPKMMNKALDFINDPNDPGPFDLSRLLEDEDQEKGFLSQLMAFINKWRQGDAEKNYSADSKVRDLLDDPETRAVLTRYCDEQYLQDDLVKTITRMGLTLRRVQSLAPQDVFPPSMLEQLDSELRQVKKED